MNRQADALRLAGVVTEHPEDYPLAVFQAALMLRLEPESEEVQKTFLEVHANASNVKTLLCDTALPFPPDEGEYYEPGELTQRGVEIGTESLAGWTLKLFPEQLRRHCLVVGMTGSGKTNVLRLIALALGEIDK